jgi:hypothetical protein
MSTKAVCFIFKTNKKENRKSDRGCLIALLFMAAYSQERDVDDDVAFQLFVLLNVMLLINFAFMRL